MRRTAHIVQPLLRILLHPRVIGRVEVRRKAPRFDFVEMRLQRRIGIDT